MTNKELVEFVVSKLLEQGCKSEGQSPNGIYDPNAKCSLYRSPNGHKCAAGHLIKDEYYSDSLEGWNIHNPKVRMALIDSGIMENQFFLVDMLQWIHDTIPVAKWPDEFHTMQENFK